MSMYFVIAFVLLMGYQVYNLYTLMFPTIEIPEGTATIAPLWESGAGIYFTCYLSPFSTWKAEHFNHSSVAKIGEQKNLTFDWAPSNEHTLELNISADASTWPKEMRVILFNAIRLNETLHAHLHVTRERSSPDPKGKRYGNQRTVHTSIPLIKFETSDMAKNATKLLGDYHPFFQDDEIPAAIDPLEQVYQGDDMSLTAPVVSFWKPHISLRLVTDFRHYPLKAVPGLVHPSLKVMRTPEGGFKYMPVMYLDESMLTSDKLIKLNRSVNFVPLKISYEPMSFARWQMLLILEQSFKQQAKLGLKQSDIDDARSSFSSTNPVLLLITIIVSVLHTVFEFLAFKSDIQFWKNQNSSAGISTRGMISSLISQTVILLYLNETGASLLILGPHCVTIFIQMWKVFKVTGAALSWSDGNGQPCFPYFRVNENGPTRTAEIDRIAMKYMYFIMVPLMVGYLSYSLVFVSHARWASWLLSSMAGMVYAFGFIMMTPQLVINYQLKSVSQLPWKTLVYRAINTFIDDLFAFIIYMPTMHRLSCFRDDIIFFIYMYQRYIYPVDATRHLVDEDGDEAEGKIGNEDEAEGDNEEHPHEE